jgi:hypothetical protein
VCECCLPPSLGCCNSDITRDLLLCFVSSLVRLKVLASETDLQTGVCLSRAFFELLLDQSESLLVCTLLSGIHDMRLFGRSLTGRGVSAAGIGRGCLLLLVFHLDRSYTGAITSSALVRG